MGTKLFESSFHPDGLKRRTMDASEENNVKSVRRSKEEKKLLRKQIKASHTLLKHEGIRTASQPSRVTEKYRLFSGKWSAVDARRRAGSHGLQFSSSVYIYICFAEKFILAMWDCIPIFNIIYLFILN